MSKINKSQLKKLVEQCSTSTALQIIIEISENVDSNIHDSAILNLSRYNENKNNYINGIDKPEVVNIINKNTLDLINRLPDREYENPLPTLVRNIVIQQKTLKRNRRLKLFLVATSVLLLATAFWILLPKDPLGISGKWYYTVTPDYNGGKLLGRFNTNESFRPLFDKICGNVEIKPIGFWSVNYTMTGERTEMWYEENGSAINYLLAPIGLTFTELSHEERGDQNHFFFRFVADGDDKNKGFVTIDFPKRLF